ncbi:unnamed protein product, partial [Rotaria magnacalcarata]
MEPDFERRLIQSMSGCSSLSSSPFSSPVSSPSPIKHSDRFIPLRSLSQPSAFFIDQEQMHKGPMVDKKSSRDPSITTTTTNTGTNSSTNGTTIAADRTKDILTYQALLQNEMFGTQIDSLYDEQHMNSVYSNSNSNHHLTGNTNQPGTNDSPMNGGVNTQGGNATVNVPSVGGLIHTTSISGINGILCQSSQQRLPYTNTNSSLLRTRDPNTIFRYSARRNA